MSSSSASVDLSRYGWDEDWQSAFAPFAAQGLIPGRVARVDRGLCDVVTSLGTLRADTALVTPRDPVRIVCTGDWAAVAEGVAEIGAQVRALLPRRTAVIRSGASRRSLGQVLAANVDTVVIAVSLAVEPDLGRVERFLALAWESGATPVVALTKADLAPDAQLIRADIERIAPDVPVHVVSATEREGLAELRAVLGEGTVLVGQSGVGKSTLANALVGEDAMDVRAIGVDGKGRHTTTTRELLPLPGGRGVLIDTPGLRGVGVMDVAGGLQQVFADIDRLAADCRFADCGHLGEPECAVQRALDEGELSYRRLDSYRKLQRENQWMARRADVRLRAEARRARIERDRHWRGRGRDARANRQV
ncbi:ribosome small subunit-dependent GTPase A [Streptacidiphilus jiangxiensis]|uniref:Small ribosomal subunit biogenesis GTPase RsgA n=1 Tax=Streptacidiphilus jiangxiensis TaxID=235985 RepID=A0A1H8AU11_STRJI|nr:ribosome small subunit-dependent GTPase A [Streptacidiphilus jiangxiensis]SEM73996.1 ribosome biogenesis GTPase [Streptacidiphilus jiangxiensis]